MKLKASPGRMTGKRASELAKHYLEAAKLEKGAGRKREAVSSLNEARKLLSYARRYQ